MKGDETMAKYMALWEMDTSRTPEDPKAKKAQHLSFLEIVATQIKDGIIKDWGVFAGEGSGFVVVEGNAVKLHTLLAMWSPFVRFKTRESLTVSEAIKANKALPE